jgi:hypothetical protein
MVTRDAAVRANPTDEAAVVARACERTAWCQKARVAGVGRAANRQRAWWLVGVRLEAGFAARDNAIWRACDVVEDWGRSARDCQVGPKAVWVSRQWVDVSGLAGPTR